MMNRRKSTTRDILRVFEIALFFAVSVLGYGLLAASASAGTKNKNRSHPADVRKQPSFSGLNRELRELSATPRTPSGTTLTFDGGHMFSVIPEAHGASHAYRHPFPAPPLSHLDSAQSPRFSPKTPLLPYNLLQQSPVLLV
jgi:hypothetical protein